MVTSTQTTPSATDSTSEPPLFGTAIQRMEDRQLLLGTGQFIADLDIADALHVAYVTSMFPHGRIAAIDVDAARKMPGVVDIITASDLDIGPYPALLLDLPEAARRPLLASDRVRFVGEAIAAVVATSAALAEDAVEAVVVDIDPLPALTSVETAIESDIHLYPGHPSNVISHVDGGDEVGHVDDCEVVVEARIVNNRVAACPLETRVSVSYWEGDRVIHYAACQGVHPIRRFIAKVLGIDRSQVRVISPEVGGSFGAKGRAYPEEVLLPWISRRLGRPIRWVPPRSTDMLGLGHGRAQVQYIRMGGRRDGTIEAIEARLIQDTGGYVMTAPHLAKNTGALLSQSYRIPHIKWSVDAVATNTTPITSYRGAGRPEAAALIERTVDLFARRVEVDPAEVRRLNFIDEFPYRSPTGLIYDSGSYHEMLEQALAAAGYEALRSEQAARRRAGDQRALGIGLATFVDRTAGVAGSEYAGVELRPDGRVLLRTGSNPYGQGHHTGWKMIVSDVTGLAMDQIEVVHGDTDVVPRGGTTGGSKSVQRAGSAVDVAARQLVDRARSVAARMLEAAVEDVVLDLARGEFHVAGTPSRTVSWQQLAAVDEEQLAEIKCETDFEGDPTVSAGAYVAVVEVDVTTGKVDVVRFISVDDAGRILNPLLALGQVHGAIAQGIGQALTEEIIYDDDGNPVTTNFADYGIITGDRLPMFESTLIETASPNNPLGAKGIAENGTIGAPPAVQNAVVDALSHLGVRHLDMPCTPLRVWEAIRDAGA